MRAGLAEALDAGAWGMSTGLVYPPGAYATTDEIVAVGEELRGRDALYASHIRNEADELGEAVDEAIEIGRRLGVRVEISHLKSVGLRNHGKIGRALERIDAARAAGGRVAFDVYPYTAGSTMLTQVLPPWLQDAGQDELIVRLRSPQVRARLRQELDTGLPALRQLQRRRRRLARDHDRGRAEPGVALGRGPDRRRAGRRARPGPTRVRVRAADRGSGRAP